MSPRSLLVLGKKRNMKLRRALRERGFAPVRARNMQVALRRVKGGNVAGVLVPRQQGAVDVLEFVLNARDMDRSVPILVAVGTGESSVDQAIVDVGGAALLGDDGGPGRLAAEVERILGRSGRDPKAAGQGGPGGATRNQE